MKTKPIEWRSSEDPAAYFAYCNGKLIGYVNETSTDYFSMCYTSGSSLYISTASEARLWVEAQFKEFVESISA